MQVMEFTCPLPPSVNSYLGKRVAYNPITRKYFVQVYETAEAKAFKRHMSVTLTRIKEEIMWQKTGEFTYVVCEIKVYLDKKRKDADNMFKCILDSLTENGVIYDDSMIMPRVKNIYIDAENPRVEVLLYEHSKKGVFPNYNTQRIFEKEYCERCSRYSRNCSIRKKALENKIQECIKKEDRTTITCDSFKKRKEID